MNQVLIQKGNSVKAAARQLVKFTTNKKNAALAQIADEIESNRSEIKEANAIDLSEGKKKGLSAAFLDRLELTDKRIDGMIGILNDVIHLKDPVGEIIGMNTLPNGLRVGQMRMPLGVIGIIFESRPNVCIEVAALTIKSANGVILRGGSDAIHSNITLTKIIKTGLKKAGLPEAAVEVVDQQLGVLGRISGMFSTPAHDILEVDGPAGEILIPAIVPFLVRVDRDSAQLHVNLPEGLVPEVESSP